MRSRREVYAACSLIAGSLVALIVGGAILLPRFSFSTLELEAARQRWATRPFSHYRLMLEYGEWGYCRQSIDIQNNHVVTVLQDTCATPAPTIDELFDRIEQDMLALSGRCGVNGCGCDGTIVVSAGYDPRYGYPRFKRVGLNPEARLWFPEYWRRRFEGSMCSQRQLARDNITVVALLPIG
jgi:hypothetical protein